MHFLVILNKGGGTLRTLDVDAFLRRAQAVLEAAGHSLETRLIGGEDVNAVFEQAVREPRVDVIMAGGGDGTISAAAASMMGSDKVLAVLPAGTMNLFARTLGIPLSLDAALEALASGRILAADIASANGKPFVHQFSVGMHPRIVEMRSRMQFYSRLGKIGASIRAAFQTIQNPVKLKVTLTMPHTRVIATTAGISISNNLYGEGHLPFSDRPDGGVLGVYITRARSRGDLLLLCLQVAMGRWRENQQVEIHETATVSLNVRSRRRRQRCVIDGELYPLAAETEIKIHPGALRVLVPSIAAGEKAPSEDEADRA